MKTDIRESFTDFQTACLMNQWAEHTDPKKVKALWEASTSREAFLDALRTDDDLRWGQACGVLFKDDPAFIADMVARESFTTTSDAGGVRIGNENFSFIVPNGRGDGISHVAVVDDSFPLNTDAMNFFTIVNGDFIIYDYDCGGDPAMEVSGSYIVYYGGGYVVFVKM